MTVIDDYFEGSKDCEDHIPARAGMSDDYYRGYGDQEELEEDEHEQATNAS